MAAKLTSALKALQERYDYVFKERRDGDVWVFQEKPGRFDPGQGWELHYRGDGRTLRSLFMVDGEPVSGELEDTHGSLKFMTKPSVQYGEPWTGSIWVSDGEGAVKEGVAGIPIPSAEVKRVLFRVTAFDPQTYAVQIADPEYYDRQENRLDASGQAAGPPTPTAVLVTDDGSRKLWRDGDPSTDGVVSYYDREGNKIYEEHRERGVRHALGVFRGGRGYVWHEADGSASFTDGKKRHHLVREDGRPVVRVETGKRTQTIEAAGAISDPKAFAKRFAKLYGPFLDRGLQLQHEGFLVDGLEVHAYDDVVKVWTVLRDYGGNELLYIAEPGAHAGQVFWNDHESGLFAAEMIGEYVTDEGLEGQPGDEIIAALPFFDDEARSLEDVMLQIRWNRPDGAFTFLDALVPFDTYGKKKAAKKKAAKKKAAEKDGKKRVAKKKVAEKDGKKRVAKKKVAKKPRAGKK